MRLIPKLDPRISADLKTQKRPITLGLICTAIAGLLYTSTITLTKVATKAIEDIGTAIRLHQPDQVTAHLHRLGGACLIVVGIFGIRYFLVRGQITFLAEASNRLAANLRKKLFRKLMNLPVSYFTERKSGAIQSVLTNDVNVYQNAIGIIRDSIDGPIKAIGAFITILLIQPYLATLALLLIPIMITVIQRNSRRMRAAQTSVQTDLAEVNAVTQEALQGTRVIKAFGAEPKAEAEYSQTIEQSFKSQTKAVMVMAALRPLVELIGAVALAIVLYIGGELAAQGKLRASDIVAMAFAMDVINQGFKNLANLSNTIASVTAASDRIYSEVLLAPEESHHMSGVRKIEKPLGRIEFSKVDFDYPDGTPALRNVSFIIEPGQSLALVGPSGAGKSTIADLILRFYEPTSGRISLDGVDFKELDVNWIRSLVGVVPQQTFLFAGSIEENVRIGREDATTAEVAEALRNAHAEEFTRDMSARTSSDLGERGIRLSGGQMQRVAIARALVRRPAILLLDEATSALDANSERAVTEALDEVMKGRTTLMIAHRLTTAARADKILYLRDGQVRESGSHAELLQLNGDYAALFRLFSGGVLDGAFA